MTVWPFLIFASGVVCWSGLHLAAALWALRRLRGVQPAEIDMEYVRIPDYHGRSVIEGRSPATLVGSVVPALPEQPGALLCESSCVVQRAARVSSIASTDSLTLRERVIIGDFADCRGEMIVEDECSIGGPVTSRTAVRLGRHVTVGSVSAPEITTSGGPLAERAPIVRPQSVHIPPPGPQDTIHDPVPGMLRRLSADTWLYRGDMQAARPLSVACKLIVIGSLSVPAGSILGDDVKTAGDLIVGEDCICRGTLVSDGDIELGAGTRFERSVYAAGEIRLKADVRGEGPDAVGVFARSLVLLGENVRVRGRISSEGSVRTS